MQRFDVHPQTPQRRLLEKAAEILVHNDGIGIYPTDTVYGLGAVASNVKALTRISSFTNKKDKKSFSFLFANFSTMSDYVKISNHNFKILKHHLPGPFTFLLPATNFVPKKVAPKRKVVGIRMPQNPVIQTLLEIVNEPIANTSLNIKAAERGVPWKIQEGLDHEVDFFLDAGELDAPYGSTIVDLTTDEPEIIRQGKGEFFG